MCWRARVGMLTGHTGGEDVPLQLPSSVCQTIKPRPLYLRYLREETRNRLVQPQLQDGEEEGCCGPQLTLTCILYRTCASHPAACMLFFPPTEDGEPPPAEPRRSFYQSPHLSLRLACESLSKIDTLIDSCKNTTCQLPRESNERRPRRRRGEKTLPAACDSRSSRRRT